MPSTLDPDSSFNLWLEKQLTEKGWTQAELARRMKVHQAVIGNIVNKKVAMGPDVARKLATALEIPQLVVYKEAGIYDEPIEPTTMKMAEVMAIFDELPDEDQETLLWLARSFRQKNKAKQNEAQSKAIPIPHKRAKTG